MKTLKNFLIEKEITDEAFEAMSAEDKAKLFNELNEVNAKAFNEMRESVDGNKAEIAKAQSTLIEIQNDQIKRLNSGVEEIGLELKKLKDQDGGANGTKKSELEKFIERDRSKRVEGQGMEGVTLKAPALMTTANVGTNVVDGFNQLLGNYIDPEIYHAPKNDPFIMDLVDTQTAPGTESIWYVERENEEGDAEFIGEGDLKPLIDGEYNEKKADVKEVAERWKMSKRLINHAPSVAADFREHAGELIQLKMDGGVLSGDGTGNNLSGITTEASPFVVPPQLADFYDDANIWDAIMSVATYVKLNKFKGPLTCILNTVWEAKMKAYKNADGDYIVPPFTTPDGKQVGEVMVRFENDMPDTHILLGELKKFKCRIAEDVQYFEGWENDDFSRNLESRKLEAFLGTYLPSQHAGSIIYDSIAVVLSAIDAVA